MPQFAALMETFHTAQAGDTASSMQGSGGRVSTLRAEHLCAGQSNAKTEAGAGQVTLSQVLGVPSVETLKTLELCWGGQQSQDIVLPLTA